MRHSAAMALAFMFFLLSPPPDVSPSPSATTGSLGQAEGSSDFDGDGFADLAAGTPREDVAGVRDAGAVTVFYGSTEGLRGSGSQHWHEGTDWVPAEPTPSDLFGFSLAPGDLNGDGFDDLAIGSPFEEVGGAENAGAVTILYGAPGGLQASGVQRFTQETADVPDDVEPGDQFGYAVGTGDLNGDGFDDLAIGVQREDLPNEAGAMRANAGAVQILYGGTDGVGTSGAVLLSQATPGVPDDPERGDAIGSAISTPDMNGDGFAEVAIGAPYEDIESVVDPGAVLVVLGSANGAAPEASAIVHQAMPGVADRPERADVLGWALASGDLNGDGFDELIAPAHGDSVSGRADAGLVHVFLGGIGGIRSKASVTWHQDVEGIPGVAGSADAFGKAVAVGDLTGDGFDDLAIGARYDDEGGAAGAGVAHVLLGSATGATAAGAQLWTQTSTASGETSEAKDHFGSALAIAPVSGGTRSALVIGVHFETVGPARYAGAFHVLPGEASGASALGAQLWTQDSPNVPDTVESNDFFPFALGAR